jgi:hypothetical protein
MTQLEPPEVHLVQEPLRRPQYRQTRSALAVDS